MLVGVGGSRGRAVEGGEQVAPLHPIAQIRHQAGSTISYQHHRSLLLLLLLIVSSVFYCLLSLDGPLHAFLHLLSTTSSPSSLLYSVHNVGLIIISRSTAWCFKHAACNEQLSRCSSPFVNAWQQLLPVICTMSLSFSSILAFFWIVTPSVKFMV